MIPPDNGTAGIKGKNGSEQAKMMKQQTDTLMKTIVRYSLSNYFRQLLSILTAFIRPRLLSPELFGLWNLLKVIQTYGSYLHLGARSTMRYRIPFLLAKNDRETVGTIAASAFWGSLYIHLGAAGVIAGTALLSHLSALHKIGLLAFAVIILLQWYYEYKLALLKAFQQFSLISSSNYLYYALTFILTVILIYLFGIYGAFGGIILSLAAVIHFLRTRSPDEIRGRFEARVFRDLVKFGAPIMIFNVIAMLIRTSDRFIVASMLGNRDLGFYSIAIMILGFLMNIPGVSREVMEPRLMEEMTSGDSGRLADEYLIRPLINTAASMPLLIGAAVYLLPVFIDIVLPRYQEGIAPARILVVGGYFLALSYVVRGIIIANNWQTEASLVMTAALFLNILISILLVKSGYGINGVAAGSALSFFFLFAGQIVHLAVKSSALAIRLKPAVAFLLVPFCVMCALFYFLSGLDRVLSLSLIPSSGLKLILFFGATAIFLLMTRKRHSLLDIARRKMP